MKNNGLANLFLGILYGLGFAYIHIVTDDLFFRLLVSMLAFLAAFGLTLLLYEMGD